MLAAGGTGGHLFPAFALAEELGRRGIPVDLVTDMRGDRYGSDFPARAIYRVPSATLASRTPGDIVKTTVATGARHRRGLHAPGQVKPGAVVGFGGYPTFPPLVAARLRRIPTAVHEQNAVLGRANRMLAKRVTAIATSFERTKFLDGDSRTGGAHRQSCAPGGHRCGHAPLRAPGRDGVVRFWFSAAARVRASSPTPCPRRCLRCPTVCASAFASCSRPRGGRGAGREAYTEAGIRADLAPFFANLPERMAKAHLVIGRAGASTVAELTVMGRPSILVPLPHAIDNDQLQNARRLAESGGAWCIEQRDLTPERLADEIGKLLAAPDTLAAAAEAAKTAGRPTQSGVCRSRLARAAGHRPRQPAYRRNEALTHLGRARAAYEDVPSHANAARCGPVHILGIGGIGMSAIAEILHAKGYTVQGSDQKDSANVNGLRAKGIRVFVGHDPVNLVGARYIVISTAVKAGNPELEAARQGSAHHPPRRDAGRADAALCHRLGHRHARQDHHDLAHRPPLRRSGRATRP